MSHDPHIHLTLKGECLCACVQCVRIGEGCICKHCRGCPLRPRPVKR